LRRLLGVLALAGVLAACSSSSKSASPPVTGATNATTATATTSPARCTVKSQTGLTRINLTVDGKSRYALVHIPAHWDTKTPVPAVFSFHGLGASATSQRSTDGFVPLSDKANFIVVYPQAGSSVGAFGAGWNLKGTTEVDYVTALLNDLEQRECVDTSRVYATGLSYGGAMTDLLACTMADRFAAVAPVSAYLPSRPCNPSRPVPMMSFHGVEDHLLPYQGGGNSGQLPFETWGAAWAKRNGCVGTPTTTQYVSTVEQLAYSGCKAPVILYRVHHNGHTWPGHPLGLNHQALVDYFSGKTSGKPYPLMVALGLTPEQFADTISLANTDIDASTMILAFFHKYTLASP
jgi:polyhydroxybutyrate depolymerase